MPRTDPEKSFCLYLCGGFLAGALIISAAALFEHSLHTVPIAPAQLWYPAVFGGLIGVLFVHLYIRLRNMRHQLKSSEKNFRLFYQRTPAMLHSMDNEGRILHVSQAWLDSLGYSRKEVIGKNFFEFISGDNTSEAQTGHFKKLMSFGEIRDVNYLLRRADGSTIEVSVSEVAQRDSDGRLKASLAVLTDLTNHRAAEQRIERLAYYDTLTGLPNRVLMNDRILQSMARARRDNSQLGVFFFDLDRFKLINDTQGHAVGDMVLRSVAQRLKKFIREGDTFARLGGDEFVILQADRNHDPNFAIMGQRILKTLAQPFHIDNREFFTTASIGVAIYPIDGEDPQTLLKSADTAMYVAKSRGRNNIQFFSDEMNAVTLAKTNLENRLRQALSHGELQQYYQPQIDLVTGRITGVEALLRWPDDDGRMIPPGQVIDIAEESGLIFPLGEWALKTACSQAKVWQDDGLQSLRMSVNLSGHQIRQANFIDQVEAILTSSGIRPDTLEIELAENSVMSQVNDSIMALTDLKVRGVSLAIDNFGTGYSSLLYLKHFPIHRIKIAQEFINDILHNQDYATITEAILSMAKSLNLSVTAVGVEDSSQLHFLRERGCPEAQGRLFGPPMSAKEMTSFLKDAENTFNAKKNPQRKVGLNSEGSREIH